ncbi:MAG TPA: peptide chain release factor 2, partial [Rikenellaceae bacterium]|nr:peptide chain release factor 2 [Rikenellaceae bacterium]
MITQEQIKDLQGRVETLDRCLNMKGKRDELELKEKQSQAPDFWEDPKKAEAFLKGVSSLKSWVTAYDSAKSAVDDLDVLLELDPESPETDEAFDHARRLVEDLELRNMLGEEGDSLGAVLTINSGAGGTEANDWSAMLMRMYMRWGERNGYKMTVTELLEGDEVGIKSATIQFEGDYAYGYLKAESGVHRLVRISPFNAQGKRQTT